MTSKQSLSRLAKASQRLNSQSDDLNELIASVEDEINTLNVGVSFWLDKPLESNPTYYGNEDHVGGYWDHHVLGYDRGDKGWGLFVMNVFDFVDDDDQRLRTQSNERFRLKDASRALRLAAVQQLDDLIDSLAKECERLSKTVEAAKRTAVIKG
jgi:hypothetical protein